MDCLLLIFLPMARRPKTRYESSVWPETIERISSTEVVLLSSSMIGSIWMFVLEAGGDVSDGFE